VSAPATPTEGFERDRWTLDFPRSGARESEYQWPAPWRRRAASQLPGRGGLFLAGGLIVPFVTTIPLAVALTLTGFEVVLNLIAFAFRRAAAHQAGAGPRVGVLNLLAAVVGLGLAAASGQFDLYAAPVVMAVSVVGLVAARLRFTHSVAVGVGYVVVF
jgi:hypothetical protein